MVCLCYGSEVNVKYSGQLWAHLTVYVVGRICIRTNQKRLDIKETNKMRSNPLFLTEHTDETTKFETIVSHIEQDVCIPK